MDKKAKTVLFMLGATVVNILIMVAIFLLLFLALVRLGSGLDPMVFQVLMIVVFIGSVALTYVIYNKLMKWVTKRWNLEEQLAPIFKRKNTNR